MTVKELKEKLNQFPDDLIVMIPGWSFYPDGTLFLSVPATNVARGVNEEDGCLFIDAYEEDEE